MTNPQCIPCSRCEDGEEMTAPCTPISDTICTRCSEGQYSHYSVDQDVRNCTNCTNCSLQNREQSSPCSVSKDATCGSCLKYYFLTVNSNDQAVCMKCSKCPRNVVAIHWNDCQRAGLPQDQQCAPGKRVYSSCQT